MDDEKLKELEKNVKHLLFIQRELMTIISVMQKGLRQHTKCIETLIETTKFLTEVIQKREKRRKETPTYIG